MKIEELKAKLKSHAPEGWSVLEGCFISMDTLATGGDHVSISPNAPRTMKYLERKAKFLPTAEQLKAKLSGLGFNAKRDGTTVYIFP